MIPKEELDKAIEIAKKYKIGKLYLVGFALHKESEDVNDYDFAVMDVHPESFFKFYGELLRTLSINMSGLSILMIKAIRVTGFITTKGIY